jgi:hypothetical protein
VYKERRNIKPRKQNIPNAQLWQKTRWNMRKNGTWKLIQTKLTGKQWWSCDGGLKGKPLEDSHALVQISRQTHHPPGQDGSSQPLHQRKHCKEILSAYKNDSVRGRSVLGKREALERERERELAQCLVSEAQLCLSGPESPLKLYVGLGFRLAHLLFGIAVINQ